MSTPPLAFENVPLGAADGATVTFAVAARETVSVVGNSVSGIRILGPLAMGLTDPAGGRVTVFDTEPTSLPRRELLAYRRRVGYLPAGEGLLQNLTLGQNVALPLRFGSDLATSEIESRLTILLAAAGLAAAGHLRPAEATAEQRRRATLARALAFDPKLVILEEPFVGLTEPGARHILDAARGGDVEGRSRRTVVALGPNLPSWVVCRFDRRFRMTAGVLEETDQ